MSDKKQAPEEALEQIKKFASEGKIAFADDSLTAEYDAEIQEIFRAVWMALKGKEPKRPLWTADGQVVGNVLDWRTEEWRFSGYTDASINACKRASAHFGIEITPDTVWEDAAAELRAMRLSREEKS